MYMLSEYGWARSSCRHIAVAGVGLMLLVSCGQAEPPPQDGGEVSGDPIKIGAIVPSTGPVAEWGQGNEAVLKMLEQETNDAGGVCERPLEIVIYDDGAQPEQAANLVRRLAGDDEVLAIAGPFTSSAAEVAFPVANSQEIVSTSQASSAPGVAEGNRPWAFRNTLDEGTYLNAVTPVLVEKEGVEQIAIAYDSADAVGTAIGTKIMPPLFADLGLEVVNGDDPVSFRTDDVDVQGQVTTLSSLDAQAIGVGAFYNGAVKLLREMGRQDLNMPIAGGSPLVSSAILEANPDVPVYAGGTYYAGLEEAADWTDRARQAYEDAGLSGDPLMFDLQVYEIVLMYIAAIEEGDLCDAELTAARSGIRDFMQGLQDFEGVSGKISMRETGDAIRDFYVIRALNGEWETMQRVEKDE